MLWNVPHTYPSESKQVKEAFRAFAVELSMPSAAPYSKSVAWAALSTPVYILPLALLHSAIESLSLSLCKGILGIAVQWRNLAMSGR